MKANTKLFFAMLVSGFVAAGSGRAVAAETMTAFQLVKEGNRFIGEQSKDKVVQIRSEKSIGSLQPNIWWIVYFDTTASMKAVEVKFGGGQMMEVKRPFRLLERAFAEDKILDRDKLKIDSDKAIDIAKKQPLLANLTVKATRLQLDRWEGTPTWKVRLYASKLSNPNKDVDIGEVFISSDEGKILKTDLHIERVD